MKDLTQQQTEENILVHIDNLIDELYSLDSHRPLNQEEHRLITALQDFQNSFDS